MKILCKTVINIYIYCTLHQNIKLLILGESFAFMTTLIRLSILAIEFLQNFSGILHGSRPN